MTKHPLMVIHQFKQTVLSLGDKPNNILWPFSLITAEGITAEDDNENTRGIEISLIFYCAQKR